MTNYPIGPIVDPKPTGTLPDLRPLPGRWLRLDPLNTERHGASLWASIRGKDEGSVAAAAAEVAAMVDEVKAGVKQA